MEIEIATVGKLFEKTLSIPDYQRPYKWQEKNVVQLLDDIWDSLNSENKTYRIGTVILHNEKNEINYHIVDGQQRLVTITLILKYLNHDKKVLPLLESPFPHNDSKSNILHNFEKIKEWFSLNTVDDKFKNYILNQCEFVRIELDDISEAFQLFDSQNARGKPLEPYDLLKAFHLREMNDNSSENERQLCVEQWEKAVNDRSLNNLGKHIYRIRKWAKGENAGHFTKDDIEEFKGMNLHKHGDYPYLKSYLLNDVFVNQLAKDEVFQRLNSPISFPFQLTQLIINGKRFFEYIDHYLLLHKVLVENNSFYDAYCKYDGHHRTGDTYVREMFEAALLYYVDKFGKELDFEENQTLIYKWCYSLRLQQARVNYASIDKHIREGNSLFKIINQSYHHKDLKKNVKINIPNNEIANKYPKINKVFNPQTTK